MNSIDAFYKSPYSSIKLSSYFNVYDQLFKKFIGLEFTFVEIGVLNGGSLFMWRNYFGPKARIIGVDLNPSALVWEDFGFEIYIGDQADPNFWESFNALVGNIDVVLDDGGHKYLQQIITVEKLVENINDGGLLVIEDIHTSYMKAFGAKRGFTFVDYAFNLVHKINYRFDSFIHDHEQNILSVEFFESIIVFKINKNLSKQSYHVKNNENYLSTPAEDYRNGPMSKFSRYLFQLRFIQILLKHGLYKKLFVTILRFFYFLYPKYKIKLISERIKIKEYTKSKRNIY